MQWIIDIIKDWVGLYLQGMILLWSGTVVDIPDGWHLCDGTNGTPDLRDKFVAGAGSTYAPGATGGAANHTHPFTSAPHWHAIPVGDDIAEGTDYDDITDTEVTTGTTDAENNLPPFYALCYIMKL